MSSSRLSHAEAAEQFIKDEPRTDWHDETLWFVRAKRDKSAHQIPDWELIRETASQIKNNVLSNIDDYLVEFEANAQRNDGVGEQKNKFRAKICSFFFIIV